MTDAPFDFPFDSSLADRQQRERALDAKQSFLIQAPAGSGKTELLIQRYLVLLAQAEKAPEEIIAITFTRKAAAEMQARIIQALENALITEAPEEYSHQLKTWNLAQAVIQRDYQEGWNLLNNPHRLRILTIDALCARITAQMPVLTRLGFQPQISEDIGKIYELAVREILSSLDSNPPWTSAVSNLLLYLDNDHRKVEKLLIAMLKRRDQWLPHIINPNPREILEQALADIIEEQLQKITILLTNQSQVVDELLTLLRYAGETLSLNETKDLYMLPTSTIAELPQWLLMANFLLKKDRHWRQRFTQREGFPATQAGHDATTKAYYAEMKARMTQLMHHFQTQDELQQAFATLLELPPPFYSQTQWSVVENLIEVLPVVVAMLHILFKEYNQVDYIEVAMRAMEALGTFDNPSDLALALDYKIRHILVDEFQDTSVTQFRLLERLTIGWTVEEGRTLEGRTLFLVGDPQQSIYRFRKAEVGLFLQAKYHGINGIHLEFLTLSVNFRSNPAIVAWLNQTFAEVFPSCDDLASGAVSFTPCTPCAPFMAAGQPQDAEISYHGLFPIDENEGERIVKIIQRIRAQNPHYSIGILVLARNHLLPILPVLRHANIPYRAVEIERLSKRTVIQDLLALTRALLHLSDRVAWLTVLRAPWCGLTLSDLTAVVAGDFTQSIWDQLSSINFSPLLAGEVDARSAAGEGDILNLISERLSAEGKQSLKRIVPILQNSLTQRRRHSLSQWIEVTWLALGGPACVENDSALKDATVFFQLLAELEQEGDIADFSQLERCLDSQFSACQTTTLESPVEVMTIHKSKGLEFDVVILPALHRQIRHDDHQLLLWEERPTTKGHNALIFAPIKTNHINAIYDYLRLQDNKRNHFEMSRLLYVAASRAKSQLHWVAQLPEKEGDLKDDLKGEFNDKGDKLLTTHCLKRPPSGSFLDKLWGPCHKAFIAAKNRENLKGSGSAWEACDIANSKTIKPDNPVPKYSTKYLRRLSIDWYNPFVIAKDLVPLSSVSSEETHLRSSNTPKIATLWHYDTLRLVGITIHRIFYLISTQAFPHWRQYDPEIQRPYLQAMLLRLGVLIDELNRALKLTEQAIENTLSDPRGRWLLDPENVEGQAEFAITCVASQEGLSNLIQHQVIDRTFIENGVRWIIDYKIIEAKTSTPQDLAAFLMQQKNQHRAQLEHYAQAMQYLDSRPIQLGLYFPLQQAWCEF